MNVDAELFKDSLIVGRISIILVINEKKNVQLMIMDYLCRK